MARLEGINFLKENVISGKKCNFSKPFAFISYAHDEEDVKIVRNVFHALYEKGYNLWIDTANIPKDENSWKKAAQDALMYEEDTCKVALFFRSEESLVREPIFEELKMIKILDHIQKIITIDIWHDEKMTAEKYEEYLIRSRQREKFNIYGEICKIVSKDNSAYRLQDIGNKLDNLVRELEEELKEAGIVPEIVAEKKEAISTEIKTESSPSTDTIKGAVPLDALMEELNAGNQPAEISHASPGHMRKWVYHTKKGANAVILWDGISKNCKVLKGSAAAKESGMFATSAKAAKSLKDQLTAQGVLNGLIFVEDCECDRIATLINLLNGGSVSMPAEMKGKNLAPLEDDAGMSDTSSAEETVGGGNVRPAETEKSEELLSDEGVYIYKNTRIRCDITSKTCTVLKGSKIQGESPKFATNAAGAKKLKDELRQSGIIENDVFMEDYAGSMATLLNLINGGSVSAPREKQKFVKES